MSHEVCIGMHEIKYMYMLRSCNVLVRASYIHRLLVWYGKRDHYSISEIYLYLKHIFQVTTMFVKTPFMIMW